MPGEKIFKPDPKDYDGKSPMVGPTVTITSEPSPVEEKNHWETSIMRQHGETSLLEMSLNDCRICKIECYDLISMERLR